MRDTRETPLFQEMRWMHVRRLLHFVPTLLKHVVALINENSEYDIICDLMTCVSTLTLWTGR